MRHPDEPDGTAERWPTVSVVVPTRERPALLRRALAGITTQSYRGDVDCVVVFDQSDPVRCWDDPSPATGCTIRWVRNRRTPGLAGARNSGVLAARGELVAFCDDDDEWLHTKLERQVAALRARPEVQVASTGILIQSGGRSTARVTGEPLVGYWRLLRSRVLELHPSTVLVRRGALLDGIGLIDEQIPGSYCEDYDWLLRAAKLAPILALQEPLVRVHWQGGSWFADRWRTIVTALDYLLEKHADLRRDPRGLARIYGQIAFAHAASGERGAARRWARRCLARNPAERRAYVALAVALGVLRADTVIRLANRQGRSI